MKKLNAMMLACGAVLAATLLVAIPLSTATRKAQNTPSDVFVYSNANATASQETASFGGIGTTSSPPAYVVRSYEGEIGIFRGQSETPEQVLSVPVDSLPATDRLLLQAGIPAQNEGELRRILEDYES